MNSLSITQPPIAAPRKCIPAGVKKISPTSSNAEATGSEQASGALSSGGQPQPMPGSVTYNRSPIAPKPSQTTIEKAPLAQKTKPEESVVGDSEVMAHHEAQAEPIYSKPDKTQKTESGSTPDTTKVNSAFSETTKAGEFFEEAEFMTHEKVVALMRAGSPQQSPKNSSYGTSSYGTSVFTLSRQQPEVKKMLPVKLEILLRQSITAYEEIQSENSTYQLESALDSIIRLIDNFKFGSEEEFKQKLPPRLTGKKQKIAIATVQQVVRNSIGKQVIEHLVAHSVAAVTQRKSVTHQAMLPKLNGMLLKYTQTKTK